MAKRQRFQTELYEGHKGYFAATVPFDPRKEWGAKLFPTGFYNSEGCLARGTVNGARFEGFIGYKYKRFWILIDDELRAKTRTSPGDVLEVMLEPRAAPRASARAAARKAPAKRATRAKRR